MNATMIQFFHCYTPGDSFLWPHAAEQAAYLAGLGIYRRMAASRLQRRGRRLQHGL